MKIITTTALLTLLFLLNATGQQADYSQIKAEAERLYAAGSYAKANEQYARVDKSALPATEARWVAFRLADTSWRAQAATTTSDATKFEQAQKDLEELIRTNDKDVDRGLVWAEAHESLADLFWTRSNQM